MAEVETHLNLWPLFVTVMPPASSLVDLASYFAGVTKLYDRNQRFATLVETSDVRSIPGAAERRYITQYQNETIDQIRRYNVFTATVVPSTLVRGAMTAMTWMFKPPNEQVWVASFGEGLSLCVEKLRADGQPIPVALEQLALRGPSVTVADVRRSA
jgi:hypothetical protein